MVVKVPTHTVRRPLQKRPLIAMAIAAIPIAFGLAVRVVWDDNANHVVLDGFTSAGLAHSTTERRWSLLAPDR
jgi:hypothetical protein